MLDILCCPKCKGDLKEHTENNKDFLVCTKCSQSYQVKDGIPVLLVEYI